VVSGTDTQVSTPVDWLDAISRSALRNAPRNPIVEKGPRIEESLQNRREILIESIKRRDLRQPIIDEGLRIMGRKRESYGEHFNDPEFVDNFYRAIRQYAEHYNPELNITKGLEEYLTTLKRIPTRFATLRQKLQDSFKGKQLSIGQVALIYTAFNGDTATILALLSHGEDADVGATVLRIVREVNYPEIVHLLKSAGVAEAP
jgi:hypothetical protein